MLRRGLLLSGHVNTPQVHYRTSGRDPHQALGNVYRQTAYVHVRFRLELQRWFHFSICHEVAVVEASRLIDLL
jgi:hypothetical protein